ncbi:MAG: guanylate kinase [Bryobacterales bacterium]|nr:guanylate kinase [Bryobacterales bacterium]
MSVVFVLSAPSGSGKSTLVRRVLDADPKLAFSISYTTRRPRGSEKEGQNYHYTDRASFERMIANGEFLEWAEVFGNYYGTHRGYLDQAAEAGRDLVLDIDVQGAAQLKEKIPDAVSLFILAPSREELEKRLRARSEDAEEVIQRRLREAAEEIRHYHQYDYVLVNHEVEQSVERLQSIIAAERMRRNRMEVAIRPILESFRTDQVRTAGPPEK